MPFCEAISLAPPPSLPPYQTAFSSCPFVSTDPPAPDAKQAIAVAPRQTGNKHVPRWSGPCLLPVFRLHESHGSAAAAAAAFHCPLSWARKLAADFGTTQTDGCLGLATITSKTKKQQMTHTYVCVKHAPALLARGRQADGADKRQAERLTRSVRRKHQLKDGRRRQRRAHLGGRYCFWTPVEVHPKAPIPGYNSTMVSNIYVQSRRLSRAFARARNISSSFFGRPLQGVPLARSFPSCPS